MTAILSFVAGASMSSNLPAEFQNYLSQQGELEATLGEKAFDAFALLVVMAAPFLTVGLWKFKKWARSAYIVATLGFFPFYPMLGPIVSNPWETLFLDISFILSGVLIAMMFTGVVSQKFEETAAAK
jgi:hypothetical protein